jgi:hypothetical protein
VSRASDDPGGVRAFLGAQVQSHGIPPVAAPPGYRRLQRPALRGGIRNVHEHWPNPDRPATQPATRRVGPASSGCRFAAPTASPSGMGAPGSCASSLALVLRGQGFRTGGHIVHARTPLNSKSSSVRSRQCTTT